MKIRYQYNVEWFTKNDELSKTPAIGHDFDAATPTYVARAQHTHLTVGQMVLGKDSKVRCDETYKEIWKS